MFGRKKASKDDPVVDVPETQDTGAATSSEGHNQTASQNYDPINGDFGPFDADSVDFREFDFSDFAKGGLDLGSIMVAVPHQGEVQVEMGESGPQMIHIITPFGRVTPVAFAAPRNGDLWSEAIQDIMQGMSNDGMQVSVEDGPWGQEVVATAGNGAMRVIGANGPRWMFRMTLAGPAELAPQLAELARGMISRTFVRRGNDPIPAGNSLPVQMPEAMAQELAKQMEARAQQQNAQLNAQQQNSQTPTEGSE